jgi:hypothetical protein
MPQNGLMDTFAVPLRGHRSGVKVAPESGGFKVYSREQPGYSRFSGAYTDALKVSLVKFWCVWMVNTTLVLAKDSLAAP